MRELRPVPRVLVTEEIAARGLTGCGRRLRRRRPPRPGPEHLLDAVKGADALIIRSATKVTADVLAAGRDLKVVGRAGIGLDNVDVEAATRRGVMVVNAPQSNIVSVAEHTMALLLAQARNVAQAHAALKRDAGSGRGGRGSSSGRTLGVLGLGRIGTLVAQRGLAFGMRIVAYDP